MKMGELDARRAVFLASAAKRFQMQVILQKSATSQQLFKLN